MASVVDGVKWLDHSLRERSTNGTFGAVELRIETYDGLPVKMHAEEQINTEPGTNLVIAARRLAEEIIRIAEEFTSNPHGQLKILVTLTTPDKSEKLPRIGGGAACKMASLTKTVTTDLSK